jgi:hypothetical protein
VDDLAGIVHRRYGGVADPTYLLDLDGRVAFYNMWTSAPVLHEALVGLMERGGRGVVGDGWNRQPHLLPAMTNGWPALERGLPQSYDEMEQAIPTSGAMIRTGYQLRPVLAPLTLRAGPLPLALRLGLLAGLLFTGVYLTRRVMR